MKQFLILLAASIITLSSCETKTQDFITQLAEQNAKYQSIHYKAQESYYYSNGLDTIHTPYEIWIQRDNTDSIRNAYVWIDNNYRPYNEIYQNGNFYIIIPSRKSTLIFSNFSEPLIEKVDWINQFAKPHLITQFARDTTNKVSYEMVNYNEKKAMQLTITKNKQEETEIINYIFDLNKMVPLEAQLELKNKDYSYFYTLKFSDYEFDSVDIKQLKNKQAQLFEQNPIDYSRDQEEVSAIEFMLHIGDAAPDFEGTFYQNNKPFKLSDNFEQKLILIDFWYTHCPPCVKAIPAISTLNEKYKNKGLVVFGLNSVDNNQKGRPYLNKFLSKRAISYDIILTQSEVDRMYKIKGYPAMYLIDKDGKIAFVEMGFEEQKFKELENKIDVLLGE